MGGGQLRAMVDELALQSERWRALKARALRINKPFLPLPELAVPMVLPVPGVAPMGEKTAMSDADVRRSEKYWIELNAVQNGQVAA